MGTESREDIGFTLQPRTEPIVKISITKLPIVENTQILNQKQDLMRK